MATSLDFAELSAHYLNRHAALQEVEDPLCMSDQVTVLVIETEKFRLG